MRSITNNSDLSEPPPGDDRQQRLIPVALDPRAVINLWSQYYQLEVVTQEQRDVPLRVQGRKMTQWTITLAGEPLAVANFWSAFDDWLEAYGVF